MTAMVQAETMYSDILVPLDVCDPQNADAALAHAALLARASGAKVHLLYVRLPAARAWVDIFHETVRDC